MPILTPRGKSRRGVRRTDYQPGLRVRDRIRSCLGTAGTGLPWDVTGSRTMSVWPPTSRNESAAGLHAVSAEVYEPWWRMRGLQTAFVVTDWYKTPMSRSATSRPDHRHPLRRILSSRSETCDRILCCSGDRGGATLLG